MDGDGRCCGLWCDDIPNCALQTTGMGMLERRTSILGRNIDTSMVLSSQGEVVETRDLD